MTGETIIERMVPSAQLVGTKFDLMTGGDIEKFSDVYIVETSDVTSSKLGLPNKSSECSTCGSTTIRDCDGHFGVIKLPATIYHPYLVSEVVQILNRICPGCKAIKPFRRKKGSLNSKTCKKSTGKHADYLEMLCKNLSGDNKTLYKFLKLKLQLPLDHGMEFRDNLLKKCQMVQKQKAAKDSQESCKYCSRSATEWYPTVKFKSSSENIQGMKTLSIIAEVNENFPKKFEKKGISEELPKDYWDFVPRYSHTQGSNIKRISLAPAQAFDMLKQLDRGLIEQFVPRKELIFLSCLPVTPNCHRVIETSRPYANGPQLSYDACTTACRRVVDVSRKISEFQQHEHFGILAPSYTANRVLDYFKTSKLRSYKPSEEDPQCKSGMKWLKDVILSKRSDNAFRMVMVGDPKIRLCEIGVPCDIAENMTIAEHVNGHNVNKLNFICDLLLLTKEELHARRKGQLVSLRKSNQLQLGDVFYRPLENGDMILVNRPPSVHQDSLIALSVKILPVQSVLSINPLCCAPLLGDFDGDCLHGFIPQSIRCRVELGELVSIEHQLLNLPDGRSLLTLTHDSLTAEHLLTETEIFFNKFEMQQFGMLCPFELPLPSKFPEPLWSGHQLLSMILPPSMDFGEGSRKVPISKRGIFSTMLKLYEKKPLDILFSAQDVLCEYLTMRGFSVSLDDFYLSSDKYSRAKLINEIRLGLQEAEQTCQTQQLILDPELEFLLESHEESGDISQSISNNFARKRTHTSQISIAAFKDVFHDLQNAILQYTRDNSLLAMIHAGSKGSLIKLVQQGACLGLQISASTLPFKMPCELSCSSWNQRNELDRHQEAAQSAGRKDDYVVIRSSFLDGLNPLQCLVHATSSRANLFSENAQLPGMLTRKLMFYMRDLYLAYDGTVRNAYGQQIVQFNYDLPDDASIKDGDICLADERSRECSGLGGQPAGLWAALSISEAAYGGLDQPISSLEASPLTNLKKVLECSRLGKSVHETVSLVLAKKLERQTYGLEYGALGVRNYLERVFFSDVVTTVTIVYAGHEVDGTRFSPWVTHFHLSKKKVAKKRLKVHHIINKLMGNYNSLLEKMEEKLPSACIINKDCSLADMEKKHFDTDCITMSFKTSGSHIQLDTIRDVMIPVLLQTVVKGFLEVKEVNILSDTEADNHGRLFLKVTSVENYPSGKFWGAIQNACIPITDLIDWECSHPDGIHNIFRAFGIGAAWRYFLHSLKTTTSDIGRKIHRQHLCMVADSLSMTGEFHGLSTKGLEQQRIHASVSSPFSQAFFSNPTRHFINAAKESSIDNLCGTVDAVSWGKEAPIGTGGPFEIIYSGKVQTTKKVNGIYKVLHSLKQDNPCQKHTEISKPYQNICDTWKGQSVVSKAAIRTTVLDRQSIPNKNHMEVDSKIIFNESEQPRGQKLFSPVSTRSKEYATSEFEAKFVAHNAGSFPDVVDMHSSLRTILHGYSIDEYLNAEDISSVIEALKYHPKGHEKLGSGIRVIKVGRSPTHPGSRCFILIRKDGTTEDFSYRKCVVGAAYHISPECGKMVEKKLYHRQQFV